MSWTETLNNFADQYIAFIWLAVVIVIVLIISKIVTLIKNRKSKKEEKPQLDSGKYRKELLDLFETEKVKSNKKTDIMEELIKANNIIKDYRTNLDSGINSEFELLKQELQTVNKTKEFIYDHGVEMAKLYEKYKRKEAHLVDTLTRLDALKETKKKLEYDHNE